MHAYEVAQKVIAHALTLPQNKQVASVKPADLIALCGFVLRVCPNCEVEDWRGQCELCVLMNQLTVQCPFPSVGSKEWHWNHSQKWEGRWVHRWASPFTRYWIVEDDTGFIVDSNDRAKYAVASDLETAKRLAEYVTRDEWERK